MVAESDKTGKKQNKRQINPNSLANLKPRNGKNGRKQQPKEFKDLLRANTAAALQTVLDIMRTGKPAEKLKAAEIILDRAYGRPTQPIAGDPEHGPIQIDIHDPAAREARINELLAKRGAGAGDTA